MHRGKGGIVGTADTWAERAPPAPGDAAREIEGAPRPQVHRPGDSGGAEELLPAEPRISIVIPCYNAARTLELQLAALARQIWAGWWEVLIVDNGSTDGTIAAAQDCVRRLGLARVRMLSARARRGAAHARNAGAAAAEGDVLAFVDADDEVGEGWLAAVAAGARRHPLFANRLEYERLNAPDAPRMRGYPQVDGLQRYIYPRFLPHAAGAGLVVHRSVHERLGGFDESLWMLEDTDYCWRAQLAGVPLVFVPEAVMHYRLRASVAAGCRQARLWARYNVMLYKRYRAHGMRRLRVADGATVWWRLLRRSPELFDRGLRARWLWDANWALGRLYGSIRYRTVGF